MAYKFLDESEQKPDFATELARQPARIGTKLATRTIGLPGDVLSLVNDLIARPITEKITGEKGKPYEETFLGKVIPTTEFHRKSIESATGEFLKPQNEIEKFTDDLFEDTALMLLPGSKSITTAKKAYLTKQIPSAFMKSLGANVAGGAAKDITGSESASDYTKMGSLFFLSLLDKPGAAKQLGELYKQAERNLPTNANISASHLSNNLLNLENKITKGRPLKNLADSEKFVVKEIGKIKDLVSNNRINISKAWAQKRSLNEELSKQLFNIPQKEGQKRAKTLAKQLNSFLNKTIDQYGATNPAFYKPFKAADQGFGTLAQSNLLSRFVENNLKYSPLTSGLLHLFGAPAGTAAAKSVIPYQIGKLGYRVAKSKTLRDIYSNTLKAAAKEDAGVFNKQLKKLDESLQEEEAKDRFKFID